MKWKVTKHAAYRYAIRIQKNFTTKISDMENREIFDPIKSKIINKMIENNVKPKSLFKEEEVDVEDFIVVIKGRLVRTVKKKEEEEKEKWEREVEKRQKQRAKKVVY